VPVLCLVARHDRIIPGSAARSIQQWAPATKVVELEAPHCLLQCVPELAAPVIRDFTVAALRR
jgi:sigma-B regulation protein RsbQ